MGEELTSHSTAAVAGETLDLVLANIEPFGRIIACGAVSQYNVPADQRYRLKNYFNIVAKQTRYQGFIVSLGHDEELKPFFVKVSACGSALCNMLHL